MNRSHLALALAVLTLTAGCLGSTSDESAGDDQAQPTGRGSGGSQDGGAGGSGEAANATDEPAAIEREFEGSATVGAPVLDPFGATGAKAQFAKASYDNGANGTWLVGYEVDVPAGYGSLEVRTDSSAGSPTDYDLFVYGPDGTLEDEGLSRDSSEEVAVDDPEEGTYLAIAYLFSGADAPVTIGVTIE